MRTSAELRDLALRLREQVSGWEGVCYSRDAVAWVPVKDLVEVFDSFLEQIRLSDPIEQVRQEGVVRDLKVEKELTSHLSREIDNLKAALKLVLGMTRPNGQQDIAVVKRATDLLDTQRLSAEEWRTAHQKGLSRKG